MAVEKSWTDSTGKISCIASAAVGQYKLVKVTGNRTVAHATAGSDTPVGVALTAATATGLDVDVLLLNHGGTLPGVTFGSVTAGAKVYPFTAGVVKASTTVASGVPVGICVTGATVSASRVEWTPIHAKTT
jgi:predicted RecA/RadA family phage recombinase